MSKFAFGICGVLAVIALIALAIIVCPILFTIAVVVGFAWLLIFWLTGDVTVTVEDHSNQGSASKETH